MDDPAMEQEARVTDIEARLAYQEDTLKTLDQALYQQQRRIDALEQLCARLAERLREVAGAGPYQETDQRPPHY